MMRLVTEGGELMLPGGAIELEIANPYFGTESIPGTTSYGFDVPATGENPRRLGFPHLYRGPGGPPPVPTDCYLDGPLWKRGSLVYRGYNRASQVYRYNFVTDATDLARDLAAVKLPSLALPPLTFTLATATATYVLAPVRNAAFFGEKNPAFAGILNYPTPAGVLRPAGPSQVYAPMLYLVPVLRQVMATFGYTITGSWVDDAEINTLVIYSDRALAASVAPGGAFNPAQQLPTLTVAQLLLGLQNLFCLGLSFNPATKQVRITPLREVVQRGSYVARPGAVLIEDGTNDTQGFLLQQAPDSEDELDKTLDVSWQQLRLGAGQEAITAAAGTLHLVREADPTQPTRTWLVPAISAKGASLDYELGVDSRTGLRLLFDRGACPDSLGNNYRLLSPGTVDLNGAAVGTYSLHWDGPAGLYAQWHQPWLDFRARAVPCTYAVPFGIADLRALDPATHELVGYHLLLWEKVSLNVSADRRLQTATFSYQELL
jgi:hypothetical protein